MLRICDLGKHMFDDGEEVYSKEEINTRLKTHEQVACNECWEKFSKQVTEKIIRSCLWEN